MKAVRTKAGAQISLAERGDKLWEHLMAGRPRRERILIAWGASIGLVIVLIFAVWMPLQESRTRLIRAVAVEQKNLATMEAIRRELKAITAPPETPSRGATLRAAVEVSAKKHLSPATLDVKLEGDNNLTVKLSKVRLSQLVSWVDATVQGQRIRLDFVTLRAENSMLTGELRFLVPES